MKSLDKIGLILLLVTKFVSGLILIVSAISTDSETGCNLIASTVLLSTGESGSGINVVELIGFN